MSSPSNSSPALFQPTKIGNITLDHRVVLAPLTRFKSGRHDHVPMVHLMKEYYSQRSSMPGTLLITEGALIAAKAVSSFNCVPGIWSPEHISAWKEVRFNISFHSFVLISLEDNNSCTCQGVLYFYSALGPGARSLCQCIGGRR